MKTDRGTELIPAKDVRPGDTLWWEMMGADPGTTVVRTATVDKVIHHPGKRTDYWEIFFTRTSGKSSMTRAFEGKRVEVIR